MVNDNVNSQALVQYVNPNGVPDNVSDISHVGSDDGSDDGSDSGSDAGSEEEEKLLDYILKKKIEKALKNWQKWHYINMSVKSFMMNTIITLECPTNNKFSKPLEQITKYELPLGTGLTSEQRKEIKAIHEYAKDFVKNSQAQRGSGLVNNNIKHKVTPKRRTNKNKNNNKTRKNAN